jgi:L-2-hydroxyglutarate oxidase LhgO
MEEIGITIVGAGVIGLNIAAELSSAYKDIFVIEKDYSFGQETSSRNSEVIHAGIYYPEDSLKARTCVEGNRTLYEICQENNIPHRRIGKIIVAVAEEELEDLERLRYNGRNCGVEGLRIISRKELGVLEPNVEGIAGLFSPNTGIIDTHRLMEYFLQRAKDNGAQVAYNTEVRAIERINSGYKISVKDAQGENFSFKTKILINSAGLNSDVLASLVGIDIDSSNYRLKYSKGQYFRVANKKANLIRHLIYPVPKPKSASLGIHATLDLGGGLRLGPDDEYIPRDNPDYSVDDQRRGVFYQAIRDFLPFIGLNDLSPDIAGIRPKLQGENEDFRDFIISDESDKGFPGFINLIGIESPGLTGSPVIAKYVKEIIEKTVIPI